MTKIRDVKSEIEDLEITMDEVITIKVLNCLDPSFPQFLGIFSHEAREKKQLHKLKNSAKSLEDKELQMRNQDKRTANYVKRFTKKKSRLTNAKPKEQKYSSNSTLTKCKFCGKEHGLNNCLHWQAECHYCHETGHTAKVCKKKAATRTSPKNIVIHTQSLPFFTRQILSTVLASSTLKSEPLDSSVQRVIIDFGAKDDFFATRVYVSTYEEYHHEFQTGLGKILSAYEYGNVILHLAHPGGSGVIWTIKKVSLALLLGHNLLSTIPLSKKDAKGFLHQFQMQSEMSKHRAFFEVAGIFDDHYFVCAKSFSLNNVFEAKIINSMNPISIQTWHCRMDHLGYQTLL